MKVRFHSLLALVFLTISAELMKSRAHEIKFVCPSSINLSFVSQLSLNPLCRFLSNFSCCFPWTITTPIPFLNFPKNLFFSDFSRFFFSTFINVGCTLWEQKFQNAKLLSNYFKILLNFLVNTFLTKVLFWIFKTLSFWFF